jgi:pantoate--beta-alanine ligase
VRDLHLPLEVVAGPTLREPDGLAMSSRNAYLSAAERQAATVLYRALLAGEALVGTGERAAAAVCARIRAVLATEPLVAIDYVAAVDAESFRPLTTLDGSREGEPAAGPGANVVLPIAVTIGRTRLIDNLRLRVPAPGVPSLPL